MNFPSNYPLIFKSDSKWLNIHKRVRQMYGMGIAHAAVQYLYEWMNELCAVHIFDCIFTSLPSAENIPIREIKLHREDIIGQVEECDREQREIEKESDKGAGKSGLLFNCYAYYWEIYNVESGGAIENAIQYFDIIYYIDACGLWNGKVNRVHRHRRIKLSVKLKLPFARARNKVVMSAISASPFDDQIDTGYFLWINPSCFGHCHCVCMWNGDCA